MYRHGGQEKYSFRTAKMCFCEVTSGCWHTEDLQSVSLHWHLWYVVTSTGTQPTMLLFLHLLWGYITQFTVLFKEQFQDYAQHMKDAPAIISNKNILACLQDWTFTFFNYWSNYKNIMICICTAFSCSISPSIMLPSTFYRPKRKSLLLQGCVIDGILISDRAEL